MSSRLISFIIIFLFILIIVFSYLYFFVYYTWNISINSNIDNYKVEMYSKTIKKTFSFDCKGENCNFWDLSPLNYDLKIFKDWYISFSKNIDIPKNDTLKLYVELKKEIKLENSTDKFFVQKISDKDKVLNLKNSKLYYSSFYLENIWNFYFKKAKNLELYFEDKKIWTFEIVDKNLIRLENIYNNSSKYNKDFFYLELWSNKFIYNIKNLDYKQINLNLKINYIKSLNNNFFIITDKWTFIYNYLTKEQEYLSLFYDFVFYKSWYIAIVKKDDKIRINNLSLEDNNKNKIIFFDTEKKEKKLLYETDLEIQKILSIQNKVIFIDIDNNEFNLNVVDI